MQSFLEFAQGHGLILDSLVHDKWVSVPTEDHPHKRNGRYKFMGSIGWVHNWATMTKPVMWRGGKPVSFAELRQMKEKADRDLRLANEKAAKRAEWILTQTTADIHEYLKRKGFPDERGNIWEPEIGTRLLVVPMRVGRKIVGCQLIDSDGGKKFLSGQVTNGAVHVFDSQGVPIFCEGYATGLSVRAAMRAARMRFTIYVCFSASNMVKIANTVSGGFVVADNDEAGLSAAGAIKKPYWASDKATEDFNDYQGRVGLFVSAMKIKLFSMNVCPKFQK